MTIKRFKFALDSIDSKICWKHTLIHTLQLLLLHHHHLYLFNILSEEFFVENWEEWAKDHGKSSKIFFFLLFFILGVPKKSEFYFLNSIFIAIFSIYDPKSTFIKGNLIEHKSEWKLDVCICVESDAVSSKGEIMWRNWAWINVCAFYRFSLAFVSRSYCKITFTQGAHTRILWDGERERVWKQLNSSHKKVYK